MATATLTIGRGLRKTIPQEKVYALTPFVMGWTNADIPTATGDDPISLILKLLISTGGGGNYSGSGTNYDAFETGIGLGVPYTRINLTSFTNITAEYDFDSAMKLAFINIGPGNGGVPAADMFEQECCRPFGIYLVTGNDGTLKAVRPKNPNKYHVSNANNDIKVKVPTGGTTFSGALVTGIYSPAEMATEVARALNAVSSGFSCTYSTSTNKFTITKAAAFDIIASADNGWLALGYTGTQTNVTSAPSDAVTGKFTGTTLTENDLWDIKAIPNRDDQITSVIWLYDYHGGVGKPEATGPSIGEERYDEQRIYLSAEDVNLGDYLAAHQFLIKSKGLQSGGGTYIGSPIAYWKETAASCTPTRVNPPSTAAVDTDSMSTLVSAMLLDRYTKPPMKFSAKLRWKHNTLEIGDNVAITYPLSGVFVDRELNAVTLTSRIFEIIKLTPNWRNGYLDATFLGHRASTTPSVVVTQQ